MLSYTLASLEEIRAAELRLLLQKHGTLFGGADILEIGTGTGAQLLELSRIGKSATGVDVKASDYTPRHSGNFTYYDGSHLPFEDRSFDVIYSSNTMEHVLDEPVLHAEMRRVLRPNGVAVHVVPSSAWRLWTMAAYYTRLPAIVLSHLRRRRDQTAVAGASPPPPVRSTGERALDVICPMRHGERGNRFTEWWHFRGASWRRRFEQLGWKVESAEGIGLFYSGFLLSGMPVAKRERLASSLGSACLVFILKAA
jgi:SAM-dependent methyltransferase